MSTFFQPAEFWGAEARATLTWMKDFDEVMSSDFDSGKFEWFKGGKLNASGRGPLINKENIFARNSQKISPL